MQSPHEPAGKTLPELLREYADELLTEKRRGAILRKVREVLAATEKKEAKAAAPPKTERGAAQRDAAAEFIERGNAAWDALATGGKALVEKDGETAYKPPDMEQSPDIGDATLRQAESQLVDAIGKLGFDAAAKVFARIAPPDERARLESMAARGRELTGCEAAPKLSAADLAAFMEHAASHQWNPESGVAPSAFIKKTFKKWLKRGLALTDIRAAQSNLAGAYSAEISRDTTKRVKGLYVRPHKLPAGAPRAAVVLVRHVADLSEEKAAKRRVSERTKKSRWRENRHALG
jgi:hypothetical protein